MSVIDRETFVSCHEGEGTIIILAEGTNLNGMIERIESVAQSFHYPGNNPRKEPSVQVTTTAALIRVVAEGGCLKSLLRAISTHLHAQCA